MKTKFLIYAIAGVALLSGSQVCLGQAVSLNLFGGYTFQDKVNFSSGYGMIEDGGHYGASLEVAVKDYASAELLYQRQDTRAIVYGFSTSAEGKLAVNYVMIGGVKYTMVGGPISPYGGLSGGMGIFEGKDLNKNSVKFAFGLKLGVLFNVSEKVGIRIQAQMLTPVQGAGGGFYFGTGGTGAGISTYSSVYQFGFTGGLQIKLRGDY
jgi:hypothetical protein